jgi:hypothetical protein
MTALRGAWHTFDGPTLYCPSFVLLGLSFTSPVHPAPKSLTFKLHCIPAHIQLKPKLN